MQFHLLNKVTHCTKQLGKSSIDILEYANKKKNQNIIPIF